MEGSDRYPSLLQGSDNALLNVRHSSYVIDTHGSGTDACQALKQVKSSDLVTPPSAFNQSFVGGTQHRNNPYQLFAKSHLPRYQTAKDEGLSTLSTSDRSSSKIPTAKARRAITRVVVHDKELSPRPALRSSYSPDQRSFYNATDSGSRHLDALFPPLAPQNSPIACPSKPETSPDSAGSCLGTAKSLSTATFSVAPSLLTNSDNSTSPTVTPAIECGIAVSARIKSCKTAHLGADKKQPQNISNRLDEGGAEPNQSPTWATSRIKEDSKLTDVFKRSVSVDQVASQAGKKASRIPRRSLPNPISISKTGDKETLAKISRVAKHDKNSAVRSGFQSGFTDERARKEISQKTNPLPRTSKYGYTIRESEEAQKLIMGKAKGCQSSEPGFPVPFNKRELGPFQKSPVSPMKSVPTTAIPESSANIPKLRRARKQRDICHKKEMHEITRQSKKVAGLDSHSPYRPFPPRGSSLPKIAPDMPVLEEELEPTDTYFRQRYCGQVPLIVIDEADVSDSDSGCITDHVASVPLPQNTLNASSVTSKMITDTCRSADCAAVTNGPVAHHSRHHLTSMGNVSKGMKMIGRKVGRMVHSRRASVPESAGQNDTSERVETFRLHDSEASYAQQGEARQDPLNDHTDKVKLTIDDNKASSRSRSPGNEAINTFSASTNDQVHSLFHDSKYDILIKEVEAGYQKLFDVAAATDEPLRDVLIKTARHLARGLVAIREARMSALALELSIDRLLVMMHSSQNAIADVHDGLATTNGARSN